MQRNNPVAQEPGQSEDKQYQSDGCQRALQFAMRSLIQTMFARSYYLSKPHDGVGQLLRVTKEQVEQPAYEQGEGISH